MAPSDHSGLTAPPSRTNLSITIAGILSYVFLVGKVERAAETTQGEPIRG
ncbi:hypothetical protein [Amycolatopsis sp. lyj-84]